MSKHYTKKELKIKEQQEELLNEYFNLIGLNCPKSSSILPKKSEEQKIYKKIVNLLPNTVKSDEYIISVLASNIIDFKYYCSVLNMLKNERNITDYITVQKVKNATCNSILTNLKSLCLTTDSRKKISVILDSQEENKEGNLLEFDI